MNIYSSSPTLGVEAFLFSVSLFKKRYRNGPRNLFGEGGTSFKMSVNAQRKHADTLILLELPLENASKLRANC